MKFTDIFSYNQTLNTIKNTTDKKVLVPFAQSNTETDTGVPDRAAEMGFNGQIGNIEDPTGNRGVSGIQLKRSFYNIFFRILTAGLPVLTDTLSSLYQFFIRDYCMNDRKYTSDLQNYYKEGDISYTEVSGRFVHRQLNKSGSWQPLTLLHDRGKTILGEPTIWPGVGTLPSWAIEIGTHTTYNWSSYPNLNNTQFKSFLSACSGFGASYTSTTFTCPDLRGMSPAVWASGAGAFLASNAGQHSHSWGSTTISTDSQTVSHSHTGTLTHTPHNHVCAARPFSTGGSGVQSWSGEKSAQSHAATTSPSGSHYHTVSFGSGTEKHTHGTGSFTPTVNTAPVGNSGTVTRVNTYPVRLIVRFE